ncbi:MAG TPA: hypothetical protein EYP30_03755 [Archaeoglobaceae archaeon]|nr:hypothetical protein [Archaeoglobaceae archaeon]
MNDLKNEVNKLLKEQFGAEIDLEFREMGKKRIYAFKKCSMDISIKHEGVYFGRLERDGIRLSIEGSFITGKVAKKGIIEVDEENAFRWMKGEEIESDIVGYIIIKWGNYFLGCGKGNGKRILNFIPKDRRI